MLSSPSTSLGLDHLVGTPALKPYMHGYFLSLKLYDAARVIANPFAYAEHREKLVRDKMDKLSESRIRARKDAQAPKVNKALAAKILREEERERKKEERRKEKTAEALAEGDREAESVEKPNLLNDARFKALFEDPAFEVDTQSREFGLLNPSTVAQSGKGKHVSAQQTAKGGKISTELRSQILMTFLSALRTIPSPAMRLPPSIQLTFLTGSPYP